MIVGAMASLRRAALVGCGLMVVLSCSASPGDNAASSENIDASPDDVVLIVSDYHWYNSLDELYEDAGAVIEAEVVRQRSEYLAMMPEPWDTSETDPRLNPLAGLDDEAVEQALADLAESDPHIYTVFDVRVLKPLKGGQALDSIIQVKQAGGEYEGVRHIEQGTQQLVPGETYLLFLYGPFGDIPWSLLNPDQGQYRATRDGKYHRVGHNTVEISPAELQELADH